MRSPKSMACDKQLRSAFVQFLHLLIRAQNSWDIFTTTTKMSVVALSGLINWPTVFLRHHNYFPHPFCVSFHISYCLIFHTIMLFRFLIYCNSFSFISFLFCFLSFFLYLFIYLFVCLFLDSIIYFLSFFTY